MIGTGIFVRWCIFSSDFSSNILELSKIVSAKSFASSSLAELLFANFLEASVYVSTVLKVVTIIIIHHNITNIAITHANNQHHQLVFHEPPVTKHVNSTRDKATPGTVINNINKTPNKRFPIGTSVCITNIAIHNTRIVRAIAHAAYFDCVEPTIALTRGLEAILFFVSIYKNIIKKMIKLYKYNS